MFKKIVKLVLPLVLVVIVGILFFDFYRSKQSYCVSTGEVNTFKIHLGSNAESATLNVNHYDHSTKTWSTDSYPIELDYDEAIITFANYDNTIYLTNQVNDSVIEIEVDESKNIAGFQFDGTRHIFDKDHEWYIVVFYCGENGYAAPANLYQLLEVQEEMDYMDDLYAVSLQITSHN